MYMEMSQWNIILCITNICKEIITWGFRVHTKLSRTSDIKGFFFFPQNDSFVFTENLKVIAGQACQICKAKPYSPEICPLILKAGSRLVWGRVTGVFIVPRFQGPSEPFPRFIRRQNSHCILHADRDLAGRLEEWKSLQARAKPSRPQTAAPAVNEWADPGCETGREQGCLTEWMKMIQPETEAKSTDTVRKWESSNLKGASSCQNVRSSKVKSIRARELEWRYLPRRLL